jgi:hypothetical protein
MEAAEERFSGISRRQGKPFSPWMTIYPPR